jgi:hypothetical protein
MGMVFNANAVTNSVTNIKAKLRIKILYLAGLALLATMLDWLVINNNWQTQFYLYVGWFLVFVVCYLILKKQFWYALSTVLVISVFEDYMYLLYRQLINHQPLHPIYCHEWVPEAYGHWASFLGYNWLGVPSSYIILPVIAGIIYFIARRYYRLHKNA